MVKIRQYDEEGRTFIRVELAECKVIADFGCNLQKIREDAIGIDYDADVKPDKIWNFNNTLPFTDEFDGICMSHLLEHIIDTRKFLKECYNSLKDGGVIAIILPDGETVPSNTLGDSSNTHEMLFTPITLKLYLENAGFKNVQTKYYDRPTAYKQTMGIFAKGNK